ncbi:MAG: carbohydrate-binding domain-containing protein, partial [Methanomicrobium sp.]|nr:carbohydrate-binding domain-containing protein [Methanomicrobium sp.]
GAGIGTAAVSLAISGVTSADYSKDDLTEAVADGDTVYVKLLGDSAGVTGGDVGGAGSNGVTVNGGSVLISSAGTYSVSGTLNDGQIVVDAGKDDIVRIILSGADITCSDSAAIYVKNADRTIITLAEGTVNKLTDGKSYNFADGDDEPTATVFSKDDLSINGKGSLTVTGNYKNGIQSKDNLIIAGGSITVTAANDAIKGKDSVCVKDGVITVNAGGDGIVATNDSDESKGYVVIDGGTVTVTSAGDGIQAASNLTVNGGKISVVSGGGSSAASGDDSAKGLKAGSTLLITGGSIAIDSCDDAVHSDQNVVVSGGTLSISAGDDGIHADTYLEIAGGVIDIAKSYEGIESKEILISGGSINLAASDDGINAADGTTSGFGGGFMTAGRCNLTVSGGYLYINANGDGLDANGKVVMTGGTVIIDGPINSGNGALDYDSSFTLSGGTLIAAGSVGMAMAPDSSSTQNSVMITFDSVRQAGTLVHIETAGGSEVLTYKPSKVYQSVVVSSPLLKTGESYVVYCGGSDSGTCTDGLYSGGKYTAGTEFERFTISDTVTRVGSSAGQFAAGGMPGGMPGMPNGGNMRGDRMNGTGMMPPDMPVQDMQGMPGMPGDSDMPPWMNRDMNQSMNPGMNQGMNRDMPGMNPGMNPNRNFNQNMN